MAYVNQLNEEEQQPGVTAPVMNGASGTLTAGGGNSTQAVASPTPVNRGGSQFADVSRYLTQNQSGGQRLASKLGNNVVAAGNQARQVAGQQTAGVNQAQNTFNQGYQANRAHALDPSILNRVSSAPRSFFNFQAPTPVGEGGNPENSTRKVRTPNGLYVDMPIQSTVAPRTGPATNVADQAGLDAFKQAQNAAYSGPKELGYNADYSQLNPLAQKASSIAENYKTNQGREDLLGGLNKPNYSDAAKNLDAVLLGASGSRKILKNASNENADIPGRVSALQALEQGAKSEATGLGQAGDAEAAGIKSGAQGAAQGAYNQFSQDYGNRLSAAQQETQRLNNQYFTGRPDEEHGYAAPTNVATTEDYDKLQALNALLGQNNTL